MKSLQLSNSVELLVFLLQDLISGFKSMWWKCKGPYKVCVRSQGAHLSQKYSFILLKPYGIGIKKYQGLSIYPCSNASIVDEDLMLLGMNLTSTTKTMPCLGKLSSVLEM